MTPALFLLTHLGWSTNGDKSIQWASSLSPQQSPSVWPLPSSVNLTGQKPVHIVPPTDPAGFFGLPAGFSSPLLSAAFSRYAQTTFPHSWRRAPADGSSALLSSSWVMSLRVSVRYWDESHPTLQTDESYSLDVRPGKHATLRAVTVYGALRGLETFSQLVTFDFDTESYSSPCVAIVDAPRFPHRGLMMDTARHFEPVAAICAMIDSLPYAKLNVLHWHMVDAQSFPFQSRSSPRLWEGAFSPSERYTQADVASVVEYARLRGVRVMVEFDMPGHNDAWCAGYPSICPSPSCKSPLNVASNETFDRISNLMLELTGGRASFRGAPAGLFPDEMIHLGGDEVNTKCWDETPSVFSWLQENGLTADGGYAFFVRRVGEMASAYGRRPVQWAEVFDHFKGQLDPRTVVHVWKGQTNVTEVLELGYQVIRNVGYSAHSWCAIIAIAYLDNLNINWTAVYSNDPCDGVPTAVLCALVLGGHGEMWGETVDASDLEPTVWPRLAAIAEKLWSPREATVEPAAALGRLHRFRCKLLERGVRAAPVLNPAARQAPPGPGSCYEQ